MFHTEMCWAPHFHSEQNSLTLAFTDWNLWWCHAHPIRAVTVKTLWGTSPPGSTHLLHEVTCPHVDQHMFHVIQSPRNVHLHRSRSISAHWPPPKKDTPSPAQCPSCVSTLTTAERQRENTWFHFLLSYGDVRKKNKAWKEVREVAGEGAWLGQLAYLRAKPSAQHRDHANTSNSTMRSALVIACLTF